MNDTGPVLISVQLWHAPLGSVPVLHYHVLHLHAIVYRMNRHLRLNFKAFGKHGKRLDKFIAESPVTSHNIFDICMKQPIDAKTHQTVAKIMERALIFRKIGGWKPVPYHHIRIMLQHTGHHLTRTVKRICVVSIYHQIAFRIDLPKHSADYIAFSLSGLLPNHSPFRPGKLGSHVRGIIIIDIHYRIRQCLLHIPYHLGDSLFLIIARD